jgi:hypothetical protein
MINLEDAMAPDSDAGSAPVRVEAVDERSRLRDPPMVNIYRQSDAVGWARRTLAVDGTMGDRGAEPGMGPDEFIVADRIHPLRDGLA